jgi:spore maturation protein CgeB
LKFWKAQKGLKVAHYFDLVVGYQKREQLYFPYLTDFDLVLSPDGFDGSEYEKAGINRVFLPQAAAKEWFYPVEGEKVHDLGFIGHGYGNRGRLFSKFSRKYDFRHVGRHDEVRDVGLHSAFCASCKIMFATNAVNDVPGYWSIRVYQHLLSKAFVLHADVPGLDKYFKSGVHLVTWKDEKDLFGKIDYYLEHPEERERIAEAGHKLALRRDTWDTRVEEMWRHVSRLVSLDTPTKNQASESSSQNSSPTSKPIRSSALTIASRARSAG